LPDSSFSGNCRVLRCRLWGMPAGEEAVFGRLVVGCLCGDCMVLHAGLRAGLACGGASSAIVVGGGCVQKPDPLRA